MITYPAETMLNQLRNSIGYKQAGVEGKRRMEQNVGAGRPPGVVDVARYERELEEAKKKSAEVPQTWKGPMLDNPKMSQLGSAMSNFGQQSKS